MYETLKEKTTKELLNLMKYGSEAGGVYGIRLLTECEKELKRRSINE